MILVVIAAPLIAWAAYSGGDEEGLTVERWINDAGASELIVLLGEEDLNTLETTNGKKSVRLECVGRDGQVVLDAEQRWPFVEDEPGYDSPHAHQRASREQLQRADPLPPPRHARSLGGQREGGLEPLSAPARIRTAVARGADVM